jgi:hypothetical protein
MAQDPGNLIWIDLDNLAARQAQNRLQDHLTDLWLGQVLKWRDASDVPSGDGI